jgi:hypothetical protein
MKVGGAIYSQCEYFFTCADLRGPRAWILCFVYHTFVPVCTLKDRNSEAPISLFIFINVV